MIVPDRLVCVPATPVREFRRATEAAIAEAKRHDPLPAEQDERL